MPSTQVTIFLKCARELWEWITFIHAKVEQLSFEKIQEIISEDNLQARKDLNDFYAQMKELDKEEKLQKLWR